MSSTVQPWLRRAVLRLVQQQLADGSDVADLEILPGGPVQVVKFLSFADEHDPEKADDIWAQVSDPEHTALVLFDRTAVQRHQK
ncbi:hypothetical protein K437DRAFT_269481 [Tilletiaria anomala UBC 951]|uniref:Uncharacterized protein n=1 Tax=Tilletiaria anomala (strain ATCC 24038 / CBS 436.72 / UBC 951) TaxID=1037660 RepID=A0A066VU18_TILAU|nr:uncharacterized protein K437DRAFT_269481 [Tilletiaria anomala UBC 951]KDN42060.1 hypothetical protein K437DRAFT_269481 [Tilletiaria anomala UBC 951]